MNKRSKIKFIKYILAICVIIFLISIIFYNISPRNINFDISKKKIFENEDVRIDLRASISRLAVSYNNKGNIYATEDHYIFRRIKGLNSFLELGHFSKIKPTFIESVKDFIARLRTIRYLRMYFGANNMAVLKSGTILVLYDKIYRSVDQGKSYKEVFNFKDNEIFHPLPNKIAVDQDDNVYFGEYNSTKRPHKIRIIKGSKDGTEWSTFYEFPSGEIFHIHSIRYDPYRNGLWVCCGDKDYENKLIYIDKNRNKMKVLGGGDQSWRIVSLITTKNFLFWCSDNDQTGSSIYKYDLLKNIKEKVTYVGKPSYYSTQLKDGTLVFSTTYEKNSLFSKTFKPEITTDLWVSKQGYKWYKVLSIPGKIYDDKYGPTRPTIILPGGDYSSKYLFITPEFTLNSNFSTKILQIIWKR